MRKLLFEAACQTIIKVKVVSVGGDYAGLARTGFVMNSLFALPALNHLLLGGVPVGPLADGAGEALVPLLVARVADGVVAVPAGGLARARRAGAAVGALATALEKMKKKGWVLLCLTRSTLLGLSFELQI